MKHGDECNKANTNNKNKNLRISTREHIQICHGGGGNENKLDKKNILVLF